MSDKKISALTAATVPLAGTEVLPIVQSGVTKKVSVADLTDGRLVEALVVNAGTGAAIANATATLGNNTGAPAGWGFVSVENCGGVAPPSSAGLSVGWNYSNGGGENNLVYGTALGGAPGLTIARYDGVTLLETAKFTTAGNLAFPAGQGIDFSADGQAAGMTSELLDDYEEGTWTATLKGSVSDPTTPVTVTGRYTKIGDTVHIWCAFANVDTTGASGNVTVIGLPFTSAAKTQGSVWLGNFTIANKYVVAYLGASSSTTAFEDVAGAGFGASLQHSAGTDRYLEFSLTYKV
jgi:hypothetical protein